MFACTASRDAHTASSERVSVIARKPGFELVPFDQSHPSSDSASAVLLTVVFPATPPVALLLTPATSTATVGKGGGDADVAGSSARLDVTLAVTAGEREGITTASARLLYDNRALGDG